MFAISVGELPHVPKASVKVFTFGTPPDAEVTAILQSEITVEPDAAIIVVYPVPDSAVSICPVHAVVTVVPPPPPPELVTVVGAFEAPKRPVRFQWIVPDPVRLVGFTAMCGV